MMTEALSSYYHLPAQISQNELHQNHSINDKFFIQNDPLQSLTAITSSGGSNLPMEKSKFIAVPTDDHKAPYTTLFSPKTKPLQRQADSNTNEIVKVEALKPLLPPCRVCGMKASGLHYGVNSCEACKGFFRRSLVNNGKLACTKGNTVECEIVPGRRNSCSYCRYQKCLRLGMSVSAIRTGRYTHQKKANDITEVKNLEKTQKETEQNEQLANITKALQEGAKHTQLIEILTTHHRTMICQRELARFKETEQLNEAIGLQTLSHEIHLSFLATTGIELDNRRKSIENWSLDSKNRLLIIISLARSIPGFSSIFVDDQVKLIKASRCEAITGMLHNHFDPKNLVFYSACSNRIMSATELFHIYDDEDFVNLLFRNACLIQKLKLNVSEILIWMALIITFPDRVELSDKASVEKIHAVLVRSLEYSLSINHPERPYLLAQVLMSFTRMRELTARSDKALSKIQQLWSSKCQLDPLWGEFIADSGKWCKNHI